MDIRGEVAAGQTLDLDAELAQSLPREVDLLVFKPIFAPAIHEERELIAISYDFREKARGDHRGGPEASLSDSGPLTDG